ncbi:MAG: ASCH domain-containing protein [Planctomycetia bacterium]|nr:ASCH domain-containing protein [Planctomycetia bacterium]
MLLFKKKFLDSIRDGSKTQTVRLWKFCRFRAGQRSYIPGIGYIRITQIDPVCLEELTEEDARLDGFLSAEALLTEIRTLYAERLDQGYRAFRLRFHLLSAEETAIELAARPPKRPRSKKKSPTEARRTEQAEE